MLTATLLMLGTAQAADADCASAYTANEIDSLLEEALLSFAALDQETFESSAARAVEQLGCIDEPVSPDLAASFHRVQGMRLVVTGQDAEAHTRFRAALTLDPAHSLPGTIAPEGGRLANAYAAGRALPIRGRLPLSAPDAYTTVVDGHEVADRPEAGPYVLQVVDGAGSVVQSDYVVEGAPALDLPAAAVVAAAPAPAAEPAAAPEPAAAAPVAAAPAADEGLLTSVPVKPSNVGEPVPTEAFAPPEPVMAPAPAMASTAMNMSTSTTATVKQKKGGKGLLVAGLASGAVAAGLYGTAVGARMQFEQAPTETTWYVTNGAYFGSVGTGALSAVLLSTFLVTR